MQSVFSVTIALNPLLLGAMFHLEQHRRSDSIRIATSFASTGSEDGSLDLAVDISSCSIELSLTSLMTSTCVSLRSYVLKISISCKGKHKTTIC